MHSLLLVLRLVHILASTLWVGFAIFISFMLSPALEDAGPAAGAIIPALGRRGITTVMPLLALLTVVSGFGLYGLIDGGDFGAFARTPTGLMLGLSGVVATLAFLIGITLTRPAMAAAAAILQSLPQLPVEERTQRLATVAQLRARGALGGKYGAALMVLAASGMAVARYL